MTAVGGPLESLTLNGRNFVVAFDADAGRKLGGSENEFQANGDGATGRLIKTKVGWGLDGLTIEVDDSRGDQEFLQELADLNDFFPIAATYPSGIVYQGSGQIVGENPASSQSATAAISLMGPGKLAKQ